MTPEHTKTLQFLMREWPSLSELSDIESVVRSIVESGGRLAGEDEVVVKRKEYDALLAESRRVDYAQEHLIAADFAYGAEGEEVCALVIEIPKTARVIGDFRHSIDSLLAGSPTAQESKE